jgi:hypothetical protein
MYAARKTKTELDMYKQFLNLMLIRISLSAVEWRAFMLAALSSRILTLEKLIIYV